MPDTCPKCGAPRGGESCPRCGLVFALYDPGRLDADVPEALKRLWEDVEADWGDRARHASFVERSLAAGHGGYAAACYRRKGDDPAARRQLELISSRLEQILMASATPQGEHAGGRGRKLAWLLALLVLAVVATLVISALGR